MGNPIRDISSSHPELDRYAEPEQELWARLSRLTVKGYLLNSEVASLLNAFGPVLGELQVRERVDEALSQSLLRDEANRLGRMSLASLEVEPSAKRGMDSVIPSSGIPRSVATTNPGRSIPVQNHPGDSDASRANVMVSVNVKTSKVTFERVLRSIGRYLDGYSASSIRCFEVPGQIKLQYYCPDPDASTSGVCFSLEELESLVTRPRGSGRLTRHTPENQKCLYQDLLAAVGHELDQVGATMILFEQLDEEFLLTYHSPSPGRHHWLRKHMVMSDKATRERMVRAARERHKKRRFRVI